MNKYRVVNINLTSATTDLPVSDVPCGGCARCCETLVPHLTPEEVSSGKYPLSLIAPTSEQLAENPNIGPIVTVFKHASGGCGLLVDGRCSVYDDRPMACKQFDCRRGHGLPKVPNMVKRKVLIMGLPGSGKTTLSAQLVERLMAQGRSIDWLNADDVRRQFDDWDFSREGRLRQSLRMRDLADKSEADIIVCDFVAPLPEMRQNFDPDILVWVDTIERGRFEDTNAVFVPPSKFDLRVTEQDADKWSALIAEKLI